MGDAIMAVFPRPVAAVRAMVRVQNQLARPGAFDLPAGVTATPFARGAFALKVGIHTGPCLAINQNDRLDYFGTTVNLTARLCGLSTGEDLVLSDVTHRDHEVAAYLADPAAHLADSREQLGVTAGRTTLKGFGADAFDVWRVKST
jgi:class 3 adenylate cyclase